MSRKRHVIFRWFYRGFFGFLGIVLLILIIIPPADAIQQSLSNNQLRYVFVIGGCYAITIVFGSGLYLTRMWTNRQALRLIPKNYIPIEKGEVSKKVRKMIVASLSRSAVIAWDSRPHVPQQPATIVSEPNNRNTIVKPAELDEKKDNGHDGEEKTAEQQEKGEHTVAIPPPRPVWGEISHNGWASPTSPDLPNLQYITVILELPHLIEARAVSLAPADATSTTEPPMPDIRAVDLLQRPAAMGLREYIGHLSSVGILQAGNAATEFLAAYEYARFSDRPLSEPEFRDLMKQFAELLRNMNPLSPAMLTSLEVDDSESDIDDDGSSSTTPITPRSRSSVSSRSIISRSGSEGTIRTAPSRRTGTHTVQSNRTQEFSTAPATPRSKKRVISRSPSINSFAQSRRPYNGSNSSSSESLRSTSQNSVIRLNRNTGEGHLPYFLDIPGAA